MNKLGHRMQQRAYIRRPYSIKLIQKPSLYLYRHPGLYTVGILLHRCFLLTLVLETFVTLDPYIFSKQDEQKNKKLELQLQFRVFCQLN